jgi:hypothetical protein
MAIIYNKFWKNLWIKEPRALQYYVQENSSNDTNIEIQDVSSVTEKKKVYKVNKRYTGDIRGPRLTNHFEDYSAGITANCKIISDRRFEKSRNKGE